MIPHATKEELRRLIARRIDEAVNQVKAENQERIEEIDAQVEAEVLADLDAAEVYAEYVALDEERDRLEARIIEMSKEVDRVFSIRAHYGTTSVYTLKAKIAEMGANRRRLLYAYDPNLRRIAELEREKDEIETAILIANSNKQTATLVERVNDLVGRKPTELERGTLLEATWSKP